MEDDIMQKYMKVHNHLFVFSPQIKSSFNFVSTNNKSSFSNVIQNSKCMASSLLKFDKAKYNVLKKSLQYYNWASFFK